MKWQGQTINFNGKLGEGVVEREKIVLKHVNGATLWGKTKNLESCPV